MNLEVMKEYAEQDMDYYDGLSPEFRAVAREYGQYPFDGEDLDDFRDRCEQFLRIEEDYYLTCA